MKKLKPILLLRKKGIYGPYFGKYSHIRTLTKSVGAAYEDYGTSRLSLEFNYSKNSLYFPIIF